MSSDQSTCETVEARSATQCRTPTHCPAPVLDTYVQFPRVSLHQLQECEKQMRLCNKEPGSEGGSDSMLCCMTCRECTDSLHYLAKCPYQKLTLIGQVGVMQACMAGVQTHWHGECTCCNSTWMDTDVLQSADAVWLRRVWWLPVPRWLQVCDPC